MWRYVKIILHSYYDILISFSYICSLYPDSGMRGVKSIGFEKVASSILASCVSHMTNHMICHMISLHIGMYCFSKFFVFGWEIGKLIIT